MVSAELKDYTIQKCWLVSVLALRLCSCPRTLDGMTAAHEYQVLQ